MSIQKTFKHQLFVKLSNWTDGYNWAKLNKDVISVPDIDKTIYYLPAKETNTITNEEMERYDNCRFDSFDT